MSKTDVIERLSEACATETGFLTIVKVEDIDDKDKCIRIIDCLTEKCDVKGCIGNDEFIIFFKDVETKEDIEEIFNYISEHAAISMGAVMVPANGNDYAELFDKADQALEESKEKESIIFYDYDFASKNLKGAMNVDYDRYKTLREFLNNYCDTYQSVACELTLSFEPAGESVDYDDFENAYRKAEEVVLRALRKSDVMTVTGNKIRVLLPEITMQNTIVVINRIKGRLRIKRLDDAVAINVTSQMLGPEREYPVWLKAVI